MRGGMKLEGLKHVRFVNGRTRREEMEEMERVLGVVKKAQVPEWEEEREVGEMVVGGVVRLKGLEKVVGEVILIAKDRAQARLNRVKLIGCWA